jgi:hypothetical protein
MDLKTYTNYTNLSVSKLKNKPPNQINRPILVGEIVRNNQKIVYAVLGHLGTPKWSQIGTQRPASGQDVFFHV